MALVILVAVTTLVQKRIITSSAYPESESPVHEFPTSQSYANGPHNSPLKREESDLLRKVENDIGDSNRMQISISKKDSGVINMEGGTGIINGDAGGGDIGGNDVISSSHVRSVVPDMDEVKTSLRNRRNEVVASIPTFISHAQKRQAWYDQLDAQNQQHSELGYAPQRVPGYLKNSGRTLFGFVMRDLTTRVMSRAIAQSNILVISSDAPAVIRLLQREESGRKMEEELRQQVNHTVGGSTLIHAKAQDHTVFGLYDGLATYSDSVDDWWEHFGESAYEPRPTWFLVSHT